MNKKIQRPFDFLENLKGKRVLVESDGFDVKGTLVSFDASLNIVVKDALINQKIKLPIVFLRAVKCPISID